MKEYALVHVKPDGTEEVLQTVTESDEIPGVVETAKYPGVWLSSTRKLLRYNKGEIHIRQQDVGLVIIGQQELNYGGTNSVWIECFVKNDEILHSICFNETMFVGYAKNAFPMWTAYTIKDLAERIGKGAAWHLQQEYDLYIAKYKLKGAM